MDLRQNILTYLLKQGHCGLPRGDKGSGSRSLNLFSLQYLAQQLSVMFSSGKTSILVLDAHTYNLMASDNYLLSVMGL